MKNGISLLYQCFSIMVYCVALTILFYFSHLVYVMEKHVDQAMYQQHVISCEVIPS
nr:hypothetical protein [uncultured Lachnoclostridium sp.]